MNNLFCFLIPSPSLFLLSLFILLLLCGQSDEGALVDAARQLGVVFEKRTDKSIAIKVVSEHDANENYLKTNQNFVVLRNFCSASAMYHVHCTVHLCIQLSTSCAIINVLVAVCDNIT